MDTKLTLKLKKEVIDRAKQYASEQKTSLSKLIESYLHVLTSDPFEHSETSPLVKNLLGAIDDFDKINQQEEYVDYLAKKYQ
jgi:hypothetical protein